MTVKTVFRPNHAIIRNTGKDPKTSKTVGLLLLKRFPIVKEFFIIKFTIAKAATKAISNEAIKPDEMEILKLSGSPTMRLWIKTSVSFDIIIVMVQKIERLRETVSKKSITFSLLLFLEKN